MLVHYVFGTSAKGIENDAQEWCDSVVWNYYSSRSPDIRALGRCAQLKSARSGHCLAHFGTARQCYTCSKHFSCVGNALLIAVWCWVDENLIITSLAFAVDYFFFKNSYGPLFFRCLKGYEISSKFCYNSFEMVNDRCCVPHLPSSPRSGGYEAYRRDR